MSTSFKHSKDVPEIKFTPSNSPGRKFETDVSGVFYAIKDTGTSSEIVMRASDSDTKAYYAKASRAAFWQHTVSWVLVTATGFGIVVYSAFQQEFVGAAAGLSAMVSAMMINGYVLTRDGGLPMEQKETGSQARRGIDPILDANFHLESLPGGILDGSKQWFLLNKMDKYSVYGTIDDYGNMVHRVLLDRPISITFSDGSVSSNKRDNYVYGIYTNFRFHDDMSWDYHYGGDDASGVANYILGTMTEQQAVTACVFFEAPKGYHRGHGQVKMLTTNWDNETGPSPGDCHYNFPCEMQSGSCVSHDEL